MTRILRLALPLYLVILFHGNQLHAAAGRWTQPSSLAEARSGSAAAVLSDGRVLITGGTGSVGPLATTEIFNTDGSFSAGAPMLDARANHTEVVLQDGRVLVAGGVTTGGAITNTAEIYDPSSNTWTLVAGGMSLQRSGHSASLLSDGRVLIAGGQSPSGTTNTLETFSPATNTFTLVTSGTLVSPRTQHAAAVLADGRVLIAGGSDGTNALKSADIFDPSSGNVSPAPNMSMPRVGLSATTLLDGTVLIAGGNNGNADLASAEIYDPIAAAFTITGNLSVARSGHLAFLLPNNNEVLLAGGTSSGTPLASAELFVPWTGSFSTTGAMAVARTAAAGSPLKQNGQLLVAGGSDGKISLASSELYSFATVMTDKTDYPPGTTVNISGSGWQPGETVTLTLVESPLYDTHGPYTAVADSNGNILNNQFMTDEHDANIRFYLTAKGSVSQAQMTFTDGSVQTISGTVTNSVTGAPVSGAIVSCSGGCNNSFSTVTDAQGKYSLLQVTFSGNSGTLTLSASAAGYKALNIAASVNNSTNNYPGNDFKLTPTTAATALSVASSTGTYGGITIVAATLTSGGSPVSGKSVTFTLNGIPVGSATTGANGLAQLANVSLSGINAGTYNAGVAASFIGDPSFGASNNTANLTVNKATANVSVTGYNTTYDGTAHTATGTATGVKGENLSGLSLSGTIHTSAGTYADAWIFTDSTGNYNSTGGTVTDIIAAAAPGVITPIQSGTSTYGTSVTLSVTLTAPAGAETPTGAVQFQFTNGGTTYNICSNGSLQTQPAETPCTITLNNGTATVTTSNLPAGTSPDAVTATYNPGNSNYTGTGVSTTINYTVSTASTQTAISITPTTGATYGDTVTLSSAVSDSAQGSTGTPTGTVQFEYSTDGGATWINIGDPVTLDTSGNAQITTTALPAGEPAVRAHYSGDSNFAVSDSGAVAYKIDRKTLTVTGITASNKPYDGKTTATVDSSNAQLAGVLANDDVHLVTSGVTGTFADANSGMAKTVTAQGLSITGTAASNYTLKQPTTTANITAVQVTVTAPSFTVAYGDPVPAPLTPTYNAFVNGEDSTVLTTQPTCTTTYTPGSSAGSNPTTSCSGAVAMNYTFTYVNGTVTVNKANATINVTPYRVTYDGAAHTAAGTATGVKGETLSGLNLSGTTHTDAGTYTTDTWTFTDATGNYNSTSGTVSDSIAKATPTVSITGGTFTYDTHPHPATATITGVANDNSLTPSMVVM